MTCVLAIASASKMAAPTVIDIVTLAPSNADNRAAGCKKAKKSLSRVIGTAIFNCQP